METTRLEKDIKIFYVTAKSYPDGIMESHQKLHSLVPFSTERKYFYLSRPENNSDIVYKVAAEETYIGEAKKYNCETLILKKGNYLSIQIKNYRNDLQSICSLKSYCYFDLVLP